MKKLSNLFLVIVFLLSTGTLSAQAIEKWKIAKLEEYIKHSHEPLIINFWATFCKPCVEEIPYFQGMAKKYKKEGIKLLLVSLDLEEAYPKIKDFAARHKFTAPIVYLNETNADIFCPKVDEKWSGAIPASLFVNNKTGYRKFYEQQLPENKLEEEIKALTSK
jgi:thiol-disulfide isomerase/thioredoxin